MDFDKKHLALVGIAVFALFLMGLGLAFKRDIKRMAQHSTQQQPTPANLTSLNRASNQTP